ncbi:MAG: YqeG family HAD IIIA-type phosphatase [Armatimonadaceae bacterium]
MRRLLTPDFQVRHVSDVSPTWLCEKGIRAVISDLDNTLVCWHNEEVATEVTSWLTTLRDADIHICLASNTRRLPRLRRLAEQMEVLHVPMSARKPSTRGLRHALALLQTEPSQTAMVGDQLLTDVLAGNRLGLTTILVNPLSPREFVATRLISRPIERLLLRRRR